MSTTEKREFLDAAPLQALIRRDLEAAKRDRPDAVSFQNGSETLALRVNMRARILMRILTQNLVTLRLADEYCTKSGRLLADVYPDLYNDDSTGFPAACKKCREEVDHDILYESKNRMHLQCRDCGRTRYLSRTPHTGGRQFAEKPVNTSEVVREYLAGWNMREIGERHGMSEHGIRSRLVKAGVPRRQRGGRRTNGLDAAHQKLRDQHEARGREAVRLRALGVPPGEVARRVGMTPSGERRAYKAHLERNPA